ncbi:MAG: spermine synthase, partial [Anaerolineae bacterium]|nr:spermine synthase [Anaerolineae bacterium]
GARALARLQDVYGGFRAVELAIMGFAIGCPLVVLAANALAEGGNALFLSEWLFLILSFVGGLLTGAQFPLANQLRLQRRGAGLSRTAGLFYAADLLGGWVGGMCGAVVLLPVLGLVGACVTVGWLKLMSFVVVSIERNLYR